MDVPQDESLSALEFLRRHAAGQAQREAIEAAPAQFSECHVGAPKIAGNRIAEWPLTCAGEWCGEFVRRVEGTR